MARQKNSPLRSADFEAISSDEDEAVVFDRETYLKKGPTEKSKEGHQENVPLRI
jgi:hypothetical protein